MLPPRVLGLAIAAPLGGNTVKKCASCSKDLPDSAQHCVFCGAKQQAPAPGPGQAKTVMGYQASDVIKQMQQQASTDC